MVVSGESCLDEGLLPDDMAGGEKSFFLLRFGQGSKFGLAIHIVFTTITASVGSAESGVSIVRH